MLAAQKPETIVKKKHVLTVPASFINIEVLLQDMRDCLKLPMFVCMYVPLL